VRKTKETQKHNGGSDGAFDIAKGGRKKGRMSGGVLVSCGAGKSEKSHKKGGETKDRNLEWGGDKQTVKTNGTVKAARKDTSRGDSGRNLLLHKSGGKIHWFVQRKQDKRGKKKKKRRRREFGGGRKFKKTNKAQGTNQV